MSKYFTSINELTIGVIREYFTHESKVDILDNLMFHSIGIDMNDMTYKFTSEIYDITEYDLLESRKFVAMLRNLKIDNILNNE